MIFSGPVVLCMRSTAKVWGCGVIYTAGHTLYFSIANQCDNCWTLAVIRSALAVSNAFFAVFYNLKTSCTMRKALAL